MPLPQAFRALGIFVRHTVLDEAERRLVVRALGEAAGDPAGVMTDTHGLARDESARRTWDVALPDELQDALIARIEALRPDIERAFGVPLAPCDGLSALRYPAGAFYRAHRDRADVPDEYGLHRRAVSIVIFVNGGPREAPAFTGGRLRFYGLLDSDDTAGIDMDPDAGTLIAFPSSLLHEVTPVEQGTRYTLVTWLLAEA